MPLLPVPTDKAIRPPRPDELAPELIVMEPLFPLLEIPVERAMAPLIPVALLAAVPTAIAPLDVAPVPD